MARILTTLVAMLLAIAGSAPAQTGTAKATPPQDHLEFDVAVVKMVTLPGDGRFAIGCRTDPGQMNCDFVMLHDLLLDAYNVAPGLRIEGPDWLHTVPYSLHAKASGPATRAELCIMLRNLLISRFQLKLHTEDRPAPIYALVVNAKGLKLSPVKYDEDPNVAAFHPIATGVDFKHTSMHMLAGFLSGWGNFGRPVIDSTGITDLFEFNLRYATKGFRPILDPPPDSDLPSIFEALQAIGLKLESRQGNVMTYIVDHIERVPSEQ